MTSTSMLCRLSLIAVFVLLGCESSRHTGYTAQYKDCSFRGNLQKEFHRFNSGAIRTDGQVADIYFRYQVKLHRLRQFDEKTAAASAEATPMGFDNTEFNRYLLPYGTFYYHAGELKECSLGSGVTLQREADGESLTLPATAKEIEKVFGKPTGYRKTYSTLP